MPLHSSPTAIGEEMMLKVMLPAYIPISAELFSVIEKYYSHDKLFCCQDIQEATELGTKLSDEADRLRSEYGQFYFKLNG
jgi:hypothetical protein